VPWILNQYAGLVLQELGFDSIDAQWFKSEGHPADFDFRINIPHADYTDIEMLKQNILEFILEKSKTDLNGSTLRKAIHNTGFTNFSLTQVHEEGPRALVGFKDDISNHGIDLLIFQNLKRQSLFIRDSLRLSILPFINALKQYKTPEALIKAIQEKSCSLAIIPTITECK